MAPKRRKSPSSSPAHVSSPAAEEYEDLGGETQFEPGSQDNENMYKVEKILDERVYRGIGQYLLKWEGMDPKTGEDYDPTWEPKQSCSNDLIRDWKILKRKDPGIVGRYTKEMERKAESKKRKMHSAAGSVKKGRDSMGPATKRGRRSTSTSHSPKPRPSSAAPSSRLTRQRLSAGHSPSHHLAGPSNSTLRSEVSPVPATSAPKSTGKFTIRLSTRNASGENHKPAPTPTHVSIPAETDANDETRSSEGAKGLPMPERDQEQSADVSRKNEITNASSPRKNIEPVVSPDAVQGEDMSEAVNASEEKEVASQVMPSLAEDEQALDSPPTLTKDPNPVLLAPPVHSTPATPSATPPQSPARRPRGRPRKIILSVSPSSGPSASSKPPVTTARPLHHAIKQILPRGSTGSESELPTHSTQPDAIDEFSSPSRPKPTTRFQQNTEIIKPRVVEKVIDGEVWMVDSQEQDSQSQEPTAGVKKDSLETNTPGDAPEAIVLDVQAGAADPPATVPSLTPNAEVEAHDDDSDLDLLSSPVTTSKSVTIVPKSNVAHRPDHPVSLTLIQEKNDEIARLQAQVQELSATIQEHAVRPAPRISRDDSAVSAKSANIDALLLKIEEMQTSIDDLATRLTASESRRAALGDDYNFVQQQYQLASNSAVQEIQQTNLLRAQVTILKQQLDLGLKQRELHNHAVKARREAELKESRMKTDFLLEQSRRTDDSIREKAAAYSKMADDFESLKRQLLESREREERLELRNEDLVDQLTLLRARQMGAFDDPASDESGTQSDADEDMTESERSPVPAPNNHPGELSYSSKGEKSNDSLRSNDVGVFTASQIMPSESQLVDHSPRHGIKGARSSPNGPRAGAAPVGVSKTEQLDHAVIDESLVDGGEGFWCKWRNNSSRCTMMFDTLQDLVAHAQDHVLTDASIGHPA